jgi:hypothetical protein
MQSASILPVVLTISTLALYGDLRRVRARLKLAVAQVTEKGWR